MRPNWIKVIIIVACLWLAVWGAITIVRKNRPTPEGIQAFITTNGLNGKSDAARTKIIDSVVGQVNRLEYDQRRELDKQRLLMPFWNSMTDFEKGRYLDLVLPSGFKQMMENLNKMEPGKRKRVVQKAVEDLRARGGDSERNLNDPQLRKIVDQGLKAFYSEASIDAKLDALPFIEALEQTVKFAP